MEDKVNENKLKKEIWLKRVIWLDVSEVYRPEGKEKENFRNYDETKAEKDPIMARVFHVYKEIHKKQTVEANKKLREKWLKFNQAEMTIMEALELMHRFIDQADPDLDVPNIVHAYQTAERLREKHPEEDWLHLTGLIHDLGKVMGIWGEPQWAVAGDTFVVGCKPADSVVFVNSTFDENPDMKNPLYNTKYGIYKPNCGLENLIMSWGHDEYMYHVIKNHPSNGLPEEALQLVRFHSFYPWHNGGDYWHLANEKDEHMLHWVKQFQQFDLYSKSDPIPNIEELQPYYLKLVDKYLPGKIKF